MWKTKRKISLKFTLYIPFLLLVFILQAMVFSRITLWGVKPLILPVAVVAAAVYEGAVRGGVFGLCAGVLCDISLDQPAIQFTLLLTVLGVLTGLLFESLLAKGFPSFFFTSAAALLLCAVLQFARLLLREGVPIYYLLETALYQTAYSLLFTVPLYWFTRSLGRLPYRSNK